MKIKLNRNTASHFIINGKFRRPKKKYNSFHEANIVCKQMNIISPYEFKLIPYYCSVCNGIHIGKNKTVLNDCNIKVLNNIEVYDLNCNF